LNEHLASLSVHLSSNTGAAKSDVAHRASPSENGCASPESAQSNPAMSSGTAQLTSKSEIRVK
jgi:hypothetical protein